MNTCDCGHPKHELICGWTGTSGAYFCACGAPGVGLSPTLPQLCECGHPEAAHDGVACFGIPSHTHPCSCTDFDPLMDNPDV